MKNNAQGDTNRLDLITFYLGQAVCGVDIQYVQEISRIVEVTRVPLTQRYITGILNLRGQLVTVIDLGLKLGLSESRNRPDQRNIIVKFEDELIGLLIDRIREVVPGTPECMEVPPANIGEIHGNYLSGVLKTPEALIGIVKLDEVLKTETTA